MHVELDKQLEEFVDKLVSSGRYGSKSDVLRDGLRLIREREDRLEILDTAIRSGLTDADTGRVKPAAEVFDRLEAKYRGMAGTGVR